LNRDGAAHRLQRAGELDKKSVTDRFDLVAAVLNENRSQQALMLRQ